MSRLRDRLERRKGGGGLGAGGSEGSGPGLFGGEVARTACGPVLVVRSCYPPDYRHGRFRASAFLDTGPGLAALAGDRSLGALAPTGALFVDTETTGLSRGTGTLPFLLGAGRIRDDGAFEIEQYFCREPDEESAALTLLAGRFEAASYLVSFNGRSFDLPILNTRFILNRIPNPGALLPHLDLLPVARRVFRRRLRHCNLGALEAEVLGLERFGDIAGWEIPAAYGRFLVTGDPGEMARVIEHNALDLVALAALGSVIERMYRGQGLAPHPLDSLGLARAAISAGEEAAAGRHLARAFEAESDEERLEACFTAARASARRGDLSQSKAWYERALATGIHVAAAHLALAKHCEHHERDFAAALRHAEQTAEAEGEEAMRRRVARLRRRLARPGAG